MVSVATRRTIMWIIVAAVLIAAIIVAVLLLSALTEFPSCTGLTLT